MLNGFDVADEVGVETATTLTFDFEAAGAAVDFSIVATTGTPMLAAFELIIALITAKYVIAALTNEAIIARAAGEPVIARPADKNIVAVVAG